MATWAEYKAIMVERWERELAFKSLALRYCRHSKKRAKLEARVELLTGVIERAKRGFNE